MQWTQAARETYAPLPPSLKLRRTGASPGEAFGVDGTRTAKSCGPDTPTLVSSFHGKQFPWKRRWQESPVTGVKTIAQGMPGCPGEPVVTTLVCFFHFAREAAGATGTRYSLRPLLSRADVSCKSSGEFAPRECGVVAPLMSFRAMRSIEPGISRFRVWCKRTIPE
jgi:hypothetical protein